MANAIEQKSHFLFYGWYVLAASFVMLAFNSSAQFIIGVMFKPILTDLGLNRADVSLAVLTNMVVFSLSMLVVGKAYDRFGPKWVILVSVAFMGLGFIGMSQMSSLLEFHLYYGILSGIGFSGCTVLVFSSLASKWFEKFTGLAVSLAIAGGNIGQFILIPLYTDLIIALGWQSTFLVIGLSVIAINAILVLWVVRGDPHQMGYQPYGSGVHTATAISEKPQKSKYDLGMREVVKTRSYWLYIGIMMVCGAGDFFVTTHLIPFLTDQGISQTSASNMLAWLGLAALIGVVVSGPLSDKTGNKILIAGAFVIRFLLFILILNFKGIVVYYVFVLGFGFTMMITAVLTVTLIGKMYGFSYIGMLTGLITTMHHMSGGVLAFAGGAIFDSTNSYRAVFIIYSILSLASVFACLLIREKRHYPKAVAAMPGKV